MGIALAGQSVRLSDLEGKLIALGYLGSDQLVTTDYGTTSAARARVVDLGESKILGTTLVFQQAIANEIRSQGQTWVVGNLVHRQHPTKPDQTMYVFDTDGVDFEAAVEALKAAGIDPDARF